MVNIESFGPHHTEPTSDSILALGELKEGIVKNLYEILIVKTPVSKIKLYFFSQMLFGCSELLKRELKTNLNEISF